MIPRIKSIKPIERYLLYVIFEDGKAGIYYPLRRHRARRSESGTAAGHLRAGGGRSPENGCQQLEIALLRRGRPAQEKKRAFVFPL